MLEHFRAALTLLTAAERRRLGGLLGLSALTAIVQTVAILSIMPFIALLADPGLVGSSERITQLTEWLGVQSYSEFLLVFGLFAIAALTIGNLFAALEHWASSRFLFALVHRLQKLLLGRMLAQPYEYFVEHNSARLGDVMLKQVERVVDGVVGTSIVVFSSVALAAFIVVMLLVVSLETTLVTLVGLLVLYLAVFLLLRRRIARHGRELTRLSGDVFTTVKETLEGIKEIRIRRAERDFIERFDRPGRRMSALAVRYSLMSFFPHFFLETLVFAGLVGIAVYFVVTTQSTGAALSVIALYGLAIYRLTPALKAAFEGMARVQHNADAVRVVREHCAAPEAIGPAREIAAPRRRLRFENVSYRYPGARAAQVEGVSLTIRAGGAVCLFGPSGAGKTTVLNLLAGLIFAQQGRLTSDDTAIEAATAASWREQVGYCPQDVFVFDDTIAHNIALSTRDAAVDRERVVAAARLARLHDFVLEHDERGYDAVVGEDGKTLSGGQRQRLGIARALYHDPAVLILDESFTGLDAANKRAILDSLFSLAGKTLIFASHDPVVAARCDSVAMMEQGRVIAHGSYTELAGSGRAPADGALSRAGW